MENQIDRDFESMGKDLIELMDKYYHKLPAPAIISLLIACGAVIAYKVAPSEEEADKAIASIIKTSKEKLKKEVIKREGT